MNRRSILLIDDNQSTRRQRAVMLLTHGYLVHCAETIEDLELPFASPAPDLVLLRADEPPDDPDGAYELIRRCMPRQKIGFLPHDGHRLCQMFMDGVLTRPREELTGNLIQTVEAIFEKHLARHWAALGR